MLDLAQSLRGTVVVEVASYIPGPLCTAILAGLGATVIKIERPGGDPIRTLPPLDQTGISPLFALLNRAKQCRTMNLREVADQTALHELLRNADVLVDGMRPGALARLGFSDHVLLSANPRLLIVAIGGAPADHPRRNEALHDLNAQALAGLLTAGEGIPRVPGIHAADMVSGLVAASATLAGLLARASTGQGGRIETSMLAAARWLAAPALALAQAGLQHDPALSGGLACYRLYQTADDRYLALAALESHFWQRVCATLGMVELIPLQYDRAAQAAVIAALTTAFRQKTLAEWLDVFAPLDACVSPVVTPVEAAGDGPVKVELPIATGNLTEQV